MRGHNHWINKVIDFLIPPFLGEVPSYLSIRQPTPVLPFFTRPDSTCHLREGGRFEAKQGIFRRCLKPVRMRKLGNERLFFCFCLCLLKFTNRLMLLIHPSTFKCLPVIFGDLFPEMQPQHTFIYYAFLGCQWKKILFKPCRSTHHQIKRNDSVEMFKLIHVLTLIPHAP